MDYLRANDRESRAVCVECWVDIDFNQPHLQLVKRSEAASSEVERLPAGLTFSELSSIKSKPRRSKKPTACVSLCLTLLKQVVIIEMSLLWDNKQHQTISEVICSKHSLLVQWRPSHQRDHALPSNILEICQNPKPRVTANAWYIEHPTP